MNSKKINLITILLYAVVFLAPSFLGRTKEQIIMLTTIGYLLGAILMIVLYRMDQEKMPFEQKNDRPSMSKIVRMGIGGAFLALLIQYVIILITIMLTNETPSSENTAGILELIKQQPLFILSGSIGAPIMEEFVFRRSLTGLIYPRLKFWPASLITASIFSLMHLDGNFLTYFSIGLFFSWLYKETVCIWTPIIAHALMNTIVFALQLINLK